MSNLLEKVLQFLHGAGAGRTARTPGEHLVKDSLSPVAKNVTGQSVSACGDGAYVEQLFAPEATAVVMETEGHHVRIHRSPGPEAAQVHIDAAQVVGAVVGLVQVSAVSRQRSTRDPSAIAKCQLQVTRAAKGKFSTCLRY